MNDNSSKTNGMAPFIGFVVAGKGTCMDAICTMGIDTLSAHGLPTQGKWLENVPGD